MIFLKVRASTRRLARLKDRIEIDLIDLAKSIAKEDYDVDKVSSELVILANALSVPVGKLRPDDILEEFVGRDFFASEALLEIELRLHNKSFKKQNEEKLTVRKVVTYLSR